MACLWLVAGCARTSPVPSGPDPVVPDVGVEAPAAPDVQIAAPAVEGCAEWLGLIARGHADLNVIRRAERDSCLGAWAARAGLERSIEVVVLGAGGSEIPTVLDELRDRLAPFLLPALLERLQGWTRVPADAVSALVVALAQCDLAGASPPVRDRAARALVELQCVRVPELAGAQRLARQVLWLLGQPAAAAAWRVWRLDPAAGECVGEHVLSLLVDLGRPLVGVVDPGRLVGQGAESWELLALGLAGAGQADADRLVALAKRAAARGEIANVISGLELEVAREALWNLAASGHDATAWVGALSLVLHPADVSRFDREVLRSSEPAIRAAAGQLRPRAYIGLLTRCGADISCYERTLVQGVQELPQRLVDEELSESTVALTRAVRMVAADGRTPERVQLLCDLIARAPDFARTEQGNGALVALVQMARPEDAGAIEGALNELPDDAHFALDRLTALLIRLAPKRGAQRVLTAQRAGKNQRPQPTRIDAPPDF